MMETVIKENTIIYDVDDDDDQERNHSKKKETWIDTTNTQIKTVSTIHQQLRHTNLY